MGDTLPVEDLVAALRAHADVMARRPDDLEAAMKVIDELRAAARAYSAAVFAHSGWGNPLVDLEEDDQDEYGEDDEYGDDALADALGDGDLAEMPPGVSRISVRARWDFLVPNPKAFCAYAADRLREAWPPGSDPDIAHHTDHPAGALGELFAVDGWDVDRYEKHGVAFAGSGWHVEHTDRTLFEMGPDERDESGY